MFDINLTPSFLLGQSGNLYRVHILCSEVQDCGNNVKEDKTSSLTIKIRDVDE